MSKLIILRGNSASGKTTIAQALVSFTRPRPIVHVAQDVVRREMLREGGENPSDSIGLIDLIVRYALQRDYDVIVEGIMAARSHREMLTALYDDYEPDVYYMQIPLAETIRRHEQRCQQPTTKPTLRNVIVEDLTKWYLPADALGLPGEQIIDESMMLNEVLGVITDGLRLP